MRRKRRVELGALRKTKGFRYLDPRAVRIERTEGGKLLFNGKHVVPRCAFPLYGPDGYIEFLDEEENVLGLLEDASKLDRVSRKALREELDRIYYTPRIRTVLRIRGMTGRSTWDVVTDRGRRTFDLHGREGIRYLSRERLVLTDVEGVRYEIRDVGRLDTRSQRTISRYV